MSARFAMVEREAGRGVSGASSGGAMYSKRPDGLASASKLPPRLCLLAEYRESVLSLASSVEAVAGQPVLRVAQDTVVGARLIRRMADAHLGLPDLGSAPPGLIALCSGAGLRSAWEEMTGLVYCVGGAIAISASRHAELVSAFGRDAIALALQQPSMKSLEGGGREAVGAASIRELGAFGVWLKLRDSPHVGAWEKQRAMPPSPMPIHRERILLAADVAMNLVGDGLNDAH